MSWPYDASVRVLSGLAGRARSSKWSSCSTSWRDRSRNIWLRAPVADGFIIVQLNPTTSSSCETDFNLASKSGPKKQKSPYPLLESLYIWR
jgi:hypothetical protein